MSDSSLKNFAYGEAPELKLRGTPPQSVLESLRVLDRLGLLTESTFWQYLSHAPVDPLFLVRIIRAHKTALRLKDEEKILDDLLYFENIDTPVSLIVNIFTNDIAVVHKSGAKRVCTREDLFKQLEPAQVGPERLARLLSFLSSELGAFSQLS